MLSPRSPLPPRPASLVVADFGCGDCKIASSIKNKVHSFDLVPLSPLVTVCDMAKVGGDTGSMRRGQGGGGSRAAHPQCVHRSCQGDGGGWQGGLDAAWRQLRWAGEGVLCARASSHLFGKPGHLRLRAPQRRCSVESKSPGSGEARKGCPSAVTVLPPGWCLAGALGSRVGGRCGVLPGADGHQPAGDPGRGQPCAEAGVGRDARQAGKGQEASG